MSSEKGTVYLNESGWNKLVFEIKKLGPSKVFIIVDKNTEYHCLPYFLEHFSSQVAYEIISITPGENFKNISTCLDVWEDLSTKEADRSSLIINLGGGVVTDLGGFIASTFKRGLSFINIPTSLLAMVDASVGGKNGVDLGNIKNQVGTVQLPNMVLLDISFLDTLPHSQLLSGMAEIIKHGLIKDEHTWKKIKSMDPLNRTEFEKLIWESVEIKNKIVQEDPFEKGKRKILNFGHTLGHAIESHFLNHKDRNPMLHGEAVAIGMILASHISSEILELQKAKVSDITQHILSLFPKQRFTKNDIEHIQKLTIYDKKNRNGKVLFVLMEDFGKFHHDCTVDNELIINAFEYYKSF
jgi:3-dehydroquinate synthase